MEGEAGDHLSPVSTPLPPATTVSVSQRLKQRFPTNLRVERVELYLAGCLAVEWTCLMWFFFQISETNLLGQCTKVCLRLSHACLFFSAIAQSRSFTTTPFCGTRELSTNFFHWSLLAQEHL